ncbi:hypothetical protein IZ6_27970 [Terrihabitans soli]|uniref:Uncharacterized protein n=1 Tax=Terrihabitans soli TaxID=708113 RepID=A0A6S6QXQ3_9HYPH|nr:hypothetical protein IZ6_27970 [Terrihabitans soli]
MDHARAGEQRMRRAAADGNEGHAFFKTGLKMGAGAADGCTELLPRQTVDAAKDKNRCAVEV